MPSTDTITLAFNIPGLTRDEAIKLLPALSPSRSDALEQLILRTWGCEEGDFIAHRDSLTEDGTIRDSIFGQACIEILNAWVDRDNSVIRYDGGNRDEDFSDMVFTDDMVVMRPDRDVPGLFHKA